MSNYILINKYGQGLIDATQLMNDFNSFTLKLKKEAILNLIHLIIQSDVSDADTDLAIEDSQLKRTYTPCVMLKKGTASHNLYIISSLPEKELGKVFRLFLSLFKIGYNKKFQQEKNHPDKWWFWDLSDSSNLELIKKTRK